jgi:pantoate--beta-alanine ligase
VSERWDGAARPGHFDGVATVVAKLFTAVRPDIAIFGEKDFQQLAVIRRMNGDVGLGVEIVGAPTVRDADGLALSSRNAYLSEDERKRALALPQALEGAREAIQSGDRVDTALGAARRQLEQAGFAPIDYVALVDAVRWLQGRREISKDPIFGAVAAVSVGVYRGMPVLDLDYAEDSSCDTDMNVVMNDGGGFIELQGTAEGHAFRRDELNDLLALAEKGIGELLAAQREALSR